MIERVLVVDDEPLARERVTGLLRALAPHAMLREAGSGTASVELIQAWHPDAVLLDIQMPGGDGFDVVARVGAAAMPPTIFVTAHDSYALRAFDVAAVDYLLKPFGDDRFGAAWQRLVERHATGAVVEQARRLTALLEATSSSAPTGGGAEARPSRGWIDRLVVKADERTIVVPLAGVQYLESDGNYVVLHAGAQRHTVRETLRSLESRLDPSQFVRIHRRLIVALAAMKELQPWFAGDQVMILIDGRKLRVSRSYRDALARRLAGTG